MMVRKMVLRLITNTVADRHVLARLPIGLRIETEVREGVPDLMVVDLGDLELAGGAELIGSQAGVGERAVGIALRVQRLARSTQASAHADEVLLQLQRRVVLNLEVVLMIGAVLSRGAAGLERAFHIE